ncbi:MAG: RidA family protein [Deltaproteobacteria bacterium]|nr:RidA family protein [Deltaproteobacteria bacterium]
MARTIQTDNAPKAIGPYSQAVLVDSCSDLLFASGQIPLSPTTGQMETGDITAQTRLVMENVRAVVEAAGFTLGNVVKSTIFLVDMGDFPKVNEVYAGYFTGSLPARATVAVAALPRGARVEIEVVCAR